MLMRREWWLLPHHHSFAACVTAAFGGCLHCCAPSLRKGQVTLIEMIARTGCRPPYRAGFFSTAGKLALVFCCPSSPIHADVTHKCASGARQSPQQAVHHPTMRWHLPDFPTIFSNSHGSFHAPLQPTPLPRPHAPLAGASSALLLFPAWHLTLYISTCFYHKTF